MDLEAVAPGGCAEDPVVSGLVVSAFFPQPAPRTASHTSPPTAVRQRSFFIELSRLRITAGTPGHTTFRSAPELSC